MTDEQTETKTVTYIPPAFGREPKTPKDALLAAADLLEEEGRWLQGDLYCHHNPEHEEYEDNPFCNGWGTCAEGALQVVTVGVAKMGSAWYGNVVNMRPCWDDETETMHYVAVSDWPDVRVPEDKMALYGDAWHALTAIVEHNHSAPITNVNDRMASREQMVQYMRDAASTYSGKEVV